MLNQPSAMTWFMRVNPVIKATGRTCKVSGTIRLLFSLDLIRATSHIAE